MAEDAVDRAGNIGEVILTLAAFVAFVAVAVVIGKIAHYVTELVWPLWTTGGAGFIVLIVGYIAGSSMVMITGAAVMGISLAIALYGAMMEG